MYSPSSSGITFLLSFAFPGFTVCRVSSLRYGLLYLCARRAGSSPVKARKILRSTLNITKKMRKNITARQPNPFNMRYRFSVNSESIRYHRIATAKPPMPKAIMNASETTRKT